MVTITSNINDFIKRFKKAKRVYSNTNKSIVEELAKKMCADMSTEIARTRSQWEEPNAHLSDIFPLDFNIEAKSDNWAVISIGDKMKRLKMKDGTLVNPAYFIEFGFGIIGENAPKMYYNEYDWEYNIHDHKTYWFFRGKNGHSEKSIGREGINFMYNTIIKYQESWQEEYRKLYNTKAGGNKWLNLMN